MARAGIFLIVVAVIAGTVACNGVPDTTPPILDPGSSLDLEIRTWHDLNAIRDNLAGHHRLMNSLNATTPGYTELAGPTANEGKGWQPIGYGVIVPPYDWRRPFTGSFDGQGYEIRDLFVRRPDQPQVGLFGLVGAGGVVDNVRLVNADVTGAHHVGGLVGELAGVGPYWGGIEGALSRSYLSGSVAGTADVGGLVRVYQLGGTVSRSYATGSVAGEEYVGGLVGCNGGGTVSSSYATGSVTGEEDVGGLVGYNGATVSNSYASGNVTGDSRVGGLVGSNWGTVGNSYSTGNATGDSTVGGLVGQNDGPVSNAYSSGVVSGDENGGGLVGYNRFGTVSNSFWDVETSGQADSAGGTGRTTADMMDIATFTDTETEGLDERWDICAVIAGETDGDHIWNIVDGQTYPFLSWQQVP